MPVSYTRIVDQHVQRRESGDDLFGQGYPVRFGGNVALNGLQGGRFALRGSQWLGATAADDDVVAGGDEALGEGKADACATARDQNGVAGHLHGSDLLWGCDCSPLVNRRSNRTSGDPTWIVDSEARVSATCETCET